MVESLPGTQEPVDLLFSMATVVKLQHDSRNIECPVFYLNVPNTFLVLLTHVGLGLPALEKFPYASQICLHIQNENSIINQFHQIRFCI